MAIKPFTRIPLNIREWSTYLSQATVTTDADSVTHEQIEPSVALSVLGRATGSTGSVADIPASGDGQYLGRRSGVLGFVALQDSDIPSTIARDTEVDAAIAVHAAAADPHTGYAQEATGTFTGTLTGCTTSPTATLRYTKAGNVCVLYIPQLSATSNTTAMTITGGPAAIQPARAQRVLVPVQNNTAVIDGMVQVETSGTLTFYASVAGGAFTAAGTKGAELLTITYSLE